MNVRWKIVIGLMGVAGGVVAVLYSKSSGSRLLSRSLETEREVAFSRDVAPILLKHCAPCHRPGQSAPFSLLTYADAKKRAKQIAEVTARRWMPPWLPEPGSVPLADERRLTTAQIDTIQRWVGAGAPEGNPADLPALPGWSDGWHLGEPDVVLTMTEPYVVPADGKDIYRCFVIPGPMTQPRYVQAAEIRPGNPKLVHHAILQIDRTRASRRLDEQDPEPGFSAGMSAGKAQLPEGHFIGWTPGKVPSKGIDGLAWRLAPGTDLVLQLHLRPSGKSEQIQVSVGLYFAARPPTLQSHALVLRSKLIEVPAGARDFPIEKSCVLPVDVQALRIYPHAHYLGKEMKVTAVFPEGHPRLLLHIKNWDFNWQDEYRFAEAQFLPRGTRLWFQYTYDNSSDNPRNPFHPPRRAAYGQNSTDEMAELMLQVVPRVAAGMEPLRRESALRALADEIEVHEHQLGTDPNNAAAHRAIGLLHQQLGRMEQALVHFGQALRIEPSSSRAHLLLGNALAEAGRFDEALAQFREADRLQPNQPEVLNSFAQALARHPDAGARSPNEAIQLAARAVELTRRLDPVMLETLAVAYAAAGQFERVVESSELAIQAALAQQDAELADQIRTRLEAYKRSASRPND
jgi:tetratricopeptide (TPR) repeat protein